MSAKAKTRHLLAAAAIAVLGVAALPAIAQGAGSFGIANFSASVSSSQAGGHPDFTTSFEYNAEALGGAAGQVKNVTVVLPRGLVANPQASPHCSAAQLAIYDCQPSAQVGTLTTKFSIPAEGLGEEPAQFEETTGVYNMNPSPGHTATFATSLSFATVLIEADVIRDGTFRVVSHVTEISTLIPVIGNSFTVWGIPADSSHDAQRFGPPPASAAPTHSGAAPEAFIYNSSNCSEGPLPTEITVESWEGETDNVTSTMATPTGCSLLKASPTLAVNPETSQAAAPSGYALDLSVPQELAPYSLATPTLRDALVSFPQGTALSPSAANGLQACSEAEIGLTNGDPVTCPDASKIGTVEIETPFLDSPLSGSVFAAAQGQNPFDSLLAVYFTLEGLGVGVKLAGEVKANPLSGQLTTVFTKNPPLPFSQLRVRLFGGPGAALSNPTQCGPATSTSVLTFYSSTTTLEPSSTFNVTGCGAPRFAPTMTAGSTNSKAGAFSPFSLDIARTDADQTISGIQVRMPRGLAGMLSSVTPCPEPQASSGNCPASSQIGHVIAGAGPGSAPVYLPGPGQPQDPVYLTTSYKGAPFGLSVVVPAKAGPFDLGTVITRAQVNVDPVSARVLINSDPLPQILAGIPLQIRSVHVEIDRSAFTFNPTSCAAQNVTSSLTSAQGMVAAPKSPYSASRCGALKFAPRLSLSAKGSSKRTGNPALHAVVNYPKGPQGTYANIGWAQVTLPATELLDNSHIGTVCTRVLFAAGGGNGEQCPAASVYGHAEAITPVLSEPISGPVFLRSNPERELPDLVAALSGPVDVALAGHIDSRNGGLRTTFEGVPDVPVSKFTLNLFGGKKGLLENTTGVCSTSNRAIVNLVGQNGKVAYSEPAVANSCKRKTSKKHRRHR